MAYESFYRNPFPLGKESTEYRLLTKDYISTTLFEGNSILKVDPEGLTILAEEAFRDVSFFMRDSQLEQWKHIAEDPEATDNDRYVATEMLRNAVISAEAVFPLCQDTGTAIVTANKGHRVWTSSCDKESLSKGIYNAYRKNSFRYSQNAPLDMYEEINTGNNLPAQIEVFATEGDSYDFLFIAKGGGSANKTHLFQETKAVLNPDRLVDFMASKINALGTAACPPYHLVFVVGGTSAEANLKTVKLASAGYLDGLPHEGDEHGRAFRDIELENKLIELSRSIGLGAQFGGKYFCLDSRVIRLPRHGASCPIGMGVSCSAHRNIKGKITRKGIFLERLETEPERFLPERIGGGEESISLDLDRPMDMILAELGNYPVGTRLILKGNIIVARDIAHAKLKKRLDNGEGLPQYFKDHIIYYAGPAKTPPGYASGSLGPTTGGRMDPYVPVFQEQGGSMIMLAKGNRSRHVTESCRRFGGFYLGSIGGVAARFGKECVTNIETLEYPELGMEAILMITVKDFPAFIIVDNKGNDFYEKIGQ